MYRPSTVLLGLGIAAGVWAIAGTIAVAVISRQLSAPYRLAQKHYKTTGDRYYPTGETQGPPR